MDYIRNKYGCPVKVRRCVDCGNEWVASTGGKGRRVGGRCDSCYPAYRSSVNLFYSSRTRAASKSLDHDLTLEYILAQVRKGFCARTGVAFKSGGSDYSDRNPDTPSIDRIDPTKGYTKDNVQFVTWHYNQAKGRFSDEEVLDLCKRVIKFAEESAQTAETEQL